VQVAARLVLVQVKNKRERSLPVRPPGVEKTSRLGSRDPVASGVKCGPHGGKKSKTKSSTVSWLSLKTKVEPVQGSDSQPKSARGFWLVYSTKPTPVATTWRLSHEWDWCGGCTESAGFTTVHHKTVGVTWLSHKTKTGGSAGGDGIRARREASKRETRHDLGACVGRTRRPNGCAAIRWRTSCVDQNARVRA
jgi:hypothetical protein